MGGGGGWGGASSAFTFSEAATRNILWKKVFLKLFEKFLRTPFLQNTSEQLSSENLLTGQQKIDLCHIKSSSQIYQLSFLNKKWIEVLVYILN